MRFSRAIPGIIFLLAATAPASAQEPVREDTIRTTAGPLRLGFVGHGTLLFHIAGKVIHVDPVLREADYRTLPKADLILVTHEHGDHLDTAAIALVRKAGTTIVVSPSIGDRVRGAQVMRNGETRTAAGFTIEAVPAYNLAHSRPDGTPFHPKGQGNGYMIDFAGTRVYVAGDTENTPEMKALKNVTVAFLPMNLPYTMTPEMVADAAQAFRPRILYPYHFGETDPQQLVKLLAGTPGVDVRIRDLK